MELDRPQQQQHRPQSSSSTTTSDLFICFTSRLSHSSSMRKSILSPGRNDKPPIPLSNSLSRRMRSNNGSLKGGQSPMFPPGVNSKKRGCAFENPEPSSPKVTCIGQVRVKTKKQGKKMKMNMKAYKARRVTSTTTTTTICDAFSCFIPCRFGEGEKGEKRENPSSSSCYRWFVAFNEGGKARDIEMVVDEEEGRMEEVVMEREVSRRRSIFDDMDFNVDDICDGGGGNGGSRVSVCVPPKNALLLMRCRSDPVKMSALVNKFWESPTREGVEEEEEIEEKRRISVREDEKIEAFSCCDELVVREEDGDGKKIESFLSCDELVVREEEEGEEKIESFSNCDELVVREEAECDKKIESFSNCDELLVREEAEDGEKVESFSNCDELGVREEDESEEKIESLSSFDGVGEDQKLLEEEDVIQGRISVSVSEDGCMNLAMLFEEQEDPDENLGQSHDPSESTPPIEQFQEEEEEIQETVVGKDSIFDHPEEEEEEEKRVAENQSRSEEQSPISEEEQSPAMEKPVLPDCLLLMMREPKLSMEVSKETWVCSTDFLRPWLPERHRQHQLKKLAGAGDEQSNKKQSKKNRGGKNRGMLPPSAPAPASAAEPPRSSCSFPISMASLIEKKLATAVPYEPFVLTRCKSEPMRTASAKLGAPPDLACCWKSSKIEPATAGVGGF